MNRNLGFYSLDKPPERIRCSSMAVLVGVYGALTIIRLSRWLEKLDHYTFPAVVMLIPHGLFLNKENSLRVQKERFVHQFIFVLTNIPFKLLELMTRPTRAVE